MDKLAKFIKGKKVDRHFKKAGGQGARLTDGPSSSQLSTKVGAQQGNEMDRVHSADVAAQAALKRMYSNEPTVSSSQKKIQMMAQRELEKERRERESEAAKFAEDVKNLKVEQPEVHDMDHSNAIDTVKYTCDMLGDEVALSKAELRVQIEEYLREQLQEEGVVAASIMIATLNKAEVRKTATETIKKYLQNILQSPEEPKFRKIRLSNKAFQERVAAAKGGKEFLMAVGFEKKEEKGEDGKTEEYLVMGETTANDAGRLLEGMELVDGAEPITLKVARDTKTYTVKEGERVTMPKLPAEFFNITGDELRREQERMIVEVDRMTTMRTREMREKDAKQAEYRYKYSLVRIRTPDSCIVQGVFGVHETIGAVRKWLHSLLASESAQFGLVASGAVLENEDETLAQLGLVPAVTLHLDYRGEVDRNILSDECMNDALPFTIE